MTGVFVEYLQPYIVLNIARVHLFISPECAAVRKFSQKRERWARASMGWARAKKDRVWLRQVALHLVKEALTEL
jgi:hypothetical protein